MGLMAFLFPLCYRLLEHYRVFQCDNRFHNPELKQNGVAEILRYNVQDKKSKNISNDKSSRSFPVSINFIGVTIGSMTRNCDINLMTR